MVTHYLAFLSWQVKSMLPPLEPGLVCDWLHHLGRVKKDALPLQALLIRGWPAPASFLVEP